MADFSSSTIRRGVMLFFGLACFSPSVPSHIRTLWVKNGGTLTHNEDDFRKANFFFCYGMEDPWLNELLSRSLIVRHAAWIPLCVSEDFLMPIADYTLDDGFDQSKIRILEAKLPPAAGASAAAVFSTTSAQKKKNHDPPPKSADASCLFPTRAPISAPFSPAVQPTNHRKRRRDDRRNEEESERELDEERLQPRKKTKWDWETGMGTGAGAGKERDAGAGATVGTAQWPVRREFPLPFSTVRAARRMVMMNKTKGPMPTDGDDAKGQATISDGRHPNGQTRIQEGGNLISREGGSDPKPKPKSKAKMAFEKCIVRSEIGGARRPAYPHPHPLPLPLRPRIPALNAPPLAPQFSPAPASASDPQHLNRKRPLTTNSPTTNTNVNVNLNAHTLFWNDILAKSFQNDELRLRLSVGDLQHAPRTKAVIFDVNKTYLGRRFINLDNGDDQ